MNTKMTRPKGAMKDWPNDDLVFKPETKAHLKAVYPKVAPIFEADDLHALFESYEGPANGAKQSARKWGTIGIYLGLTGMIIAALIPVILVMLPDTQIPYDKILGVLVCILTTTGLGVGYWLALNGYTKREWMKNRLGTERIRQFHFQSIINNLEVVIDAIDTQDYSKWKDVRAKDLAKFKNFTMRDDEASLVKLLEDEAQDEIWLSDAWKKADKVPNSALKNGLLEVWREQRLGVQLRYTRLVVGANGGGMRRRAKWMDSAISGLTFGGLIASLVVAAFYLTNQSELLVSISQTILAMLGGGSIAARAFEEGMNFTAEKDRMEWYLASLQGIKNRLDYTRNSSEQIELMRDVERLSYQEMHRFLKTMDDSKFVM